ncbi:hypothetical protein BGX23_007516 [Mortierella sp. AD031]|nr:hypothetical protein BGX23_007516 [Mortierella sp. AD031]
MCTSTEFITNNIFAAFIPTMDTTNNAPSKTAATTSSTSSVSRSSTSQSRSCKSTNASSRATAFSRRSFLLTILVLASITVVTAMPTPIPMSEPAENIKASTYGCPQEDMCIEHCKSMKSKGYCGEYPTRSCFCTLDI